VKRRDVSRGLILLARNLQLSAEERQDHALSLAIAAVALEVFPPQRKTVPTKVRLLFCLTVEEQLVGECELGFRVRYGS
jgi:hypothetical protein